jgi:hypothetical protein
MNTKTFYKVIALVSILLSTSASAHDPSKHAASKEKPNCAAMHEMDSSEIDMNDPVMKAMMQQCGKPDMGSHHDEQDEKPVCTQEHAKLGHCTMESNASDSTETQKGNDQPPIVLHNTLPPIGHDTPMNPSTPPHKRADHRKVYEVPDCENMSNMRHGGLKDPITQDMMKNCESGEGTTNKSVIDEPKDIEGDERD